MNPRRVDRRPCGSCAPCRNARHPCTWCIAASPACCPRQQPPWCVSRFHRRACCSWWCSSLRCRALCARSSSLCTFCVVVEWQHACRGGGGALRREVGKPLVSTAGHDRSGANGEIGGAGNEVAPLVSRIFVRGALLLGQRRLQGHLGVTGTGAPGLQEVEVRLCESAPLGSKGSFEVRRRRRGYVSALDLAQRIVLLEVELRRPVLHHFRHGQPFGAQAYSESAFARPVPTLPLQALAQFPVERVGDDTSRGGSVH